jgi:hypothetical protein
MYVWFITFVVFLVLIFAVVVLIGTKKPRLPESTAGEKPGPVKRGEHLNDPGRPGETDRPGPSRG